MNDYAQDQLHGGLIRRLRQYAFMELDKPSEELFREAADAIEALAALPKPQVVQAGEREVWKPIDTCPQGGFFLVHEDGAMRTMLRHEGEWQHAPYPAIECKTFGGTDHIVGQDAERMTGGHRLVVLDCLRDPTHWMELPPCPPDEPDSTERAALPATTAPEAQEVGVRDAQPVGPAAEAPTDAEFIEFAVEEQFLLFCDEEDFIDIARAVLRQWGRIAPRAALATPQTEPVPASAQVAQLPTQAPQPTLCKYGDPTCPCQDGDPCHYEGRNPMAPPAPAAPVAIDAQALAAECTARAAKYRKHRLITDADLLTRCALALTPPAPSVPVVALTPNMADEVRDDLIVYLDSILDIYFDGIQNPEEQRVYESGALRDEMEKARNLFKHAALATSARAAAIPVPEAGSVEAEPVACPKCGSVELIVGLIETDRGPNSAPGNWRGLMCFGCDHVIGPTTRPLTRIDAKARQFADRALSASKTGAGGGV